MQRQLDFTDVQSHGTIRVQPAATRVHCCDRDTSHPEDSGDVSRTRRIVHYIGF